MIDIRIEAGVQLVSSIAAMRTIIGGGRVGCVQPLAVCVCINGCHACGVASVAVIPLVHAFLCNLLIVYRSSTISAGFIDGSKCLASDSFASALRRSIRRD